MREKEPRLTLTAEERRRIAEVLRRLDADFRRRSIAASRAAGKRWRGRPVSSVIKIELMPCPRRGAPSAPTWATCPNRPGCLAIAAGENWPSLDCSQCELARGHIGLELRGPEAPIVTIRSAEERAAARELRLQERRSAAAADRAAARARKLEERRLVVEAANGDWRVVAAELGITRRHADRLIAAFRSRCG